MAVKKVFAPLTIADKKEKEKSFHNEVYVLSNFKHPNIVKLLAFSLPPNTATDFNICLIFELLSCGSLDSLLVNKDNAKLFTWEKRLTIAMQIASALIYLHRNGIYHRDVKSGNIALDEDYRAVLLDCGLSKYIPEDETGKGTAKSSTGGRVFGTPGYICESYEASKCKYDTCCEVFSFGVVLGELLSGQLSSRITEKSKKGNQLFMKDVISRVPVDPRVKEWPGECSSDLRNLAIECLKPYDDRISTMQEVLQKLQDIGKRHLPTSVMSGLHKNVLGILLEELREVKDAIENKIEGCHMDIVEDLQSYIGGKGVM